MTVLFFDTETTGFKSSTYTPRLVQLGAILQDMDTLRVLAEFNSMVVTDGFEIPEKVSDIHGITNELADKYGQTMKLVDEAFGRMIEAADLIVAHNLAFDVGIVSDNLILSTSLLDGKERYCTMLKSVDLVGIKKTNGGGNKWPRLMEAYKHFYGTEFDNAHDAMADVRACRDVYFALQGLK